MNCVISIDLMEQVKALNLIQIAKSATDSLWSAGLPCVTVFWELLESVFCF